MNGNLDGMAEVMLGGRYRLVEQLGSGGMAMVWRGYDEVLGRQVAVKVLGAQLAANELFVRRLRAEAQAVARLSHPHITGVHDYGESFTGNGTAQPFVVMELVEGVTLADLLAGGRRLPWRQAAAVGAQVAMALAEAHERGIVHRDVSSCNVMLTATGVKVLDFGISALIGEHETAEPDGLLGTPAYVAPERLRDNEVTAAVDVYAVGILLYRMLAGSLPWPVKSQTELLEAHLRRSPEPLPPVPGLPPALAQLCYHCLAKDPAQRPTGTELASRLAKMAGLRRPPALPEKAVSPAPRTTVLALRTRPLTPVADSARPLTPVADSARPLTPVADSARPLTPVSDSARPLTPVADTLTPAASLAPAAGTSPSVAPRPTARPEHPARRTVTFSAVGIVAAALAAWSFGAGEPPPANNRWHQPEQLVQAASAPCHVTFQVTRDDGRNFEAALTIQNGATAQQPTQLRFPWPGDQEMLAAQAASWRQVGRDVVVEPSAGATRVVLAGRYAQLNALPARFTFNGQECGATVLGAIPATVEVQRVADTGGGEDGGSKEKSGGKGHGGKGKGGG